MRTLVPLIAIALLVAGCGVTIGEASVATSVPTPPAAGSSDAERGHEIFTHGKNDAPPCSTCHRIASGGYGFSLGPNLVGIAERAGTRVEGLAAQDYIRQSILNPHAFVVPGYRDIMYPDFGKHLTDQDVNDLIAFLLTL